MGKLFKVIDKKGKNHYVYAENRYDAKQKFIETHHGEIPASVK